MKGLRYSNPFDLVSDVSDAGVYVKKDKDYGSDWFDDNFLNNNHFKSGENKNYLNSLFKKNSIFVWLMVVLLALLVLLSRVLYLQTIEGDNLKALAEGNRIRIREVEANRGIIYDRYGAQLVENVPIFSLAIIPIDLPHDENQREIIIKNLSTTFNINENETWVKIKNQPPYSYQPILVKENLNYEEAVLVKILGQENNGVALDIKSTRKYLKTLDISSLAHIMGYLGKISEQEQQQYLNQGYAFNDYVGKTGLEYTYEKPLRGQKGKEQVEVNARGETIEVLAHQEPVSGYNLKLTIDSQLQQKAEESLKKILQAKGKKGGVVVAVDPTSGEILALVSLPAFDDNLFTSGVSQENFNVLANDEGKPLFNRAISGEYPSGSTFKMVVGAAALEEGIVDRNTSFNSVGGIAVDSWFFPDWKVGGHGWTNITRAIAESINTYFFIVGGGYNDFNGLGVDRIKQYAQYFGLGEKLNIDLPNESTGFLPSKEWKEATKNEMWYIGDTYNLAIGQGDILVTPLQVAMWTSVFANGGTLYQPHLVKEFLDNSSSTVKSIKPKVVNKDFIKATNVEIIKQGLRQAVTSGSAKGLGSLPIAVAAKTGTAQWSKNKANHAWITTFAPYNNPQIVVTVLIEEGGEGSQVALPVAYEILDWWSNNRH